MTVRAPRASLRPFIQTLWAIDPTSSRESADADRELVLPTGAMHVAFRLSARPLTLYFDQCDAAGCEIGFAVVGGARAEPYIRETAERSHSVGAMLRPGASEALFGVPANELAGRHLSLDELWGRGALEARERMMDACTTTAALDILESLLAARLPVALGLHPAVALGLERFRSTSDVSAVVSEVGYSHRRFIELFRRAVGLTPKRYCRLLRFQRVIRRIASTGALDSWVGIALDAGYADQPHFNREFREFAGISPGAYRLARTRSAHHVALPSPNR